ncbi:hypothetical protein AVEN_125206-1 [Araneus ventricosus]|uniref:Uncharacterized protein n=1 Tax=Araneus ventricosus TaxID=182803 RepID=A0A4Y2NF75_ARAVE|nr:hypothetical protein AVEN_125206-1 [Araneus ventricosus]
MILEAADCFESASNTCKNEAEKAMKDLVGIARDLCGEDTQMLQDLQNYGSCVLEDAFQQKFAPVCLAEYGADIVDLLKPDMNNIQEYSEKLITFICPNRENLLNCGYGQIKSQCGESSEKFFRKLIDPFDELLKEACEDSASIPRISTALIFLQLLIAIFLSRKIF